MIKIKNLNVSVKNKKILKSINIEITTGKTLSILGNNGSGKSTLVKSIIGISEGRKIESDEITLNGVKIEPSVVKDSFSYIPQIPIASPGIKVKEYVALAFYATHSPFTRLKQEDQMLIDSALKKVNIFQLKEEFLTTLSGGELQKVSLALGLVYDRDVIILDEPTNHLDMKTKGEIYKIISSLKKQNKTIIWVTHDLNEAVKHSNQMLFIKDGEVIDYDEPNNIMTTDNIEKTFGVKPVIKTVDNFKTIVSHS